MPHKNETPAGVGALDRGDIAGSGEPSTAELYSKAALETEAGVLAIAVRKVTRKLEALMLVTDELGDRAAIAHYFMTDAPRISIPVWRTAWALALLVAGVVYGRTSEARLRRADLLEEITAEAQTIEAELKGVT